MDWDDSGDEFSAADESFGTPEVKPLKKAAPSLAPVQKAIKAKAPAPAKPKVPLATQDANSGVSTTSAAPKPSGKKNIEEEYVKMDQREHVLLRPDMYIGAVKKIQDTCWVMEGGRPVNKQIEYAPGLYKIFDELLVNAADNAQRDKEQTMIKVEIDAVAGRISVFNDGRGIPVEIHQKHNKYVPELIFGELLTGSNFNDSEQKVTGGRNGLGAKLANIYSTEFIVETASGSSKKQFKQIYSNNMTSSTAPQITPCKASDNWTKITFKPDLARFDMSELEPDMLQLMHKRVYDIAGCNSRLKVFLNGEHIKMKSFATYVKMFLDAEGGPERDIAFETVDDDSGRRRWEVAVTTSDGDLHQMSFVNSIWTMRGGTHVNMIADRIAKQLMPTLARKNKGAEIKPFFVKNNLWIFVNSLINNPEFDSQTKETLKSTVSTFGAKWEPSETFFKQLQKTGILDQVLNYAQQKGKLKMTRQGGAKTKHITGIHKLVDANNAGGTLILTEGDSAKALAIAGMSVVGRDYYGVFPLRGKLINVRDAKNSTILKNEEIKALLQIVGLKPGTIYEDVKSLRYGSIMIMSDQDHDGSHIKGLIINFIHHFWPSLVRFPGFLTEFITPIVKATKGQKSLSFFSMPEYEEWRQKSDTKGFKIKYYKGLGTSTSEEAREYFSDLAKHKKQFEYNGASDDEAIVMAFGKAGTAGTGAADQRKDWILSYKPGTYLDQSKALIPIEDFVLKELVLFSIANCQRAIPCLVDGLKPGQRKILFACFKRNLTKEIRVAQLSGYVSEVGAYHHGEASLQSTIVNMAQNYIGSNNVNLLHPQGQFGTRLEGGKDAASARYIHTFLSGLARLIFHPADDDVLTYLAEDGQSIEPEWYMPILPLVLLNGNKGIGTGWSSNIPNYNPRDVVANLRRLMAGEQVKPMHPWYRGFHGSIEWQPKSKQYKVSGIWTRKNETTLEVTELPVGKWTQAFKVLLEELMAPEEEDKKAGAAKKKAPAKAKKADEEEASEEEEEGEFGEGKKKKKKAAKEEEKKEKNTPQVAEYRDYSTECKVHFEVTVTNLATLSDAEIEKSFGLTSTMTVSNMHFFDAKGIITKYDDVESIIKQFYHLRLAYYSKRKEHLLAQLMSELKKLQNQVRFIQAVIAKQLVISNRKKKDLMAELVAAGYERFPPKRTRKGDAEEEDQGEEEQELEETDRDFDYLLGMKLWSLTAERVQKLQEQTASKRAEVEALEAQSPEELWSTDLEAFLMGWDQFEAAMAEFEAESAVPKKGGTVKAMPVVKLQPVMKPKLLAAPKPQPPSPGRSSITLGPSKPSLAPAKDVEDGRGMKRKLGKPTSILDSADEDFEQDDPAVTPPKKAAKVTAKAAPSAKPLPSAPAPAAAKAAPAPAPKPAAAPAPSAPKPSAATKPATTVVPKKAPVLDVSDSSEDSDEPLPLSSRLAKPATFLKPTAPITSSAPAPKPAIPAPVQAAPKPAPVAVKKAPQIEKDEDEDEDEDEEEEEESDEDLLSLSPKLPKLNSKPVKEEDDEEDPFSFTPTKQAKAQKKTAAPVPAPAKKVAAPAPAPAKKAPAPTKAEPAKKPVVKKAPKIMDSEDEDAMDLSEDLAPKHKLAPKVAPAPTQAAPARTARTAATKKVNYAVDSEEEEEFEEDSDEEEGEDFSEDDD